MSTTEDNQVVNRVSADTTPELILRTRYLLYFIMSGFFFIVVSLILFILVGYSSYRMSVDGLQFSSIAPGNGVTLDAEIARYTSTLISQYLPLVVLLIASFICALIGTRLLRSSGVVSTPVIAPQDYGILGPAISAGNDRAIDQFVRLSSLSGITGTFTKIGLTGLPLATIVLTILLAFGSIYNGQLLELAKLTLGAFLGSFVQRQASTEAGITVARQAAKEAVKDASKP
ncbi:hypothetical protein V5F40_11790 [Xanthobacter sp. DSM 14520]|uniref:hypothetical protein n=1 Tax=Xanthobacter autotrophicus (strain ATCC BAA-1158 / Py2) TaxID=78245 RepID=UPI003728B6EE